MPAGAGTLWHVVACATSGAVMIRRAMESGTLLFELLQRVSVFKLDRGWNPSYSPVRYSLPSPAAFLHSQDCGNLGRPPSAVDQLFRTFRCHGG